VVVFVEHLNLELAQFEVPGVASSFERYLIMVTSLPRSL
jgi:hypothetical protein